MSRTNRIAFLVLGLAAGCGSSFQDRHRTATTIHPPAPRDEDASEPPSPEHLWLHGYWLWDGTEYLWVGGHWAVPPRRGFVWIRSGWVGDEDHERFVFVPGRWVRAGTRVTYRHIHPSPRVQVRGERRGRSRRPVRQ